MNNIPSRNLHQEIQDDECMKYQDDNKERMSSNFDEQSKQNTFQKENSLTEKYCSSKRNKRKRNKSESRQHGSKVNKDKTSNAKTRKNNESKISPEANKGSHKRKIRKCKTANKQTKRKVPKHENDDIIEQQLNQPTSIHSLEPQYYTVTLFPRIIPLMIVPIVYIPIVFQPYNINDLNQNLEINIDADLITNSSRD